MSTTCCSLRERELVANILKNDFSPLCSEIAVEILRNNSLSFQELVRIFSHTKNPHKNLLQKNQKNPRNPWEVMHYLYSILYPSENKINNSVLD